MPSRFATTAASTVAGWESNTFDAAPSTSRSEKKIVAIVMDTSISLPFCRGRSETRRTWCKYGSASISSTTHNAC
ncbi:MAG: hypothetical protein D8M59_02540 [Planctomycetes bacterium]|nr:hypothetical protein [Planctomycetota bacterium]